MLGVVKLRRQTHETSGIIDIFNEHATQATQVIRYKAFDSAQTTKTYPDYDLTLCPLRLDLATHYPDFVP